MPLIHSPVSSRVRFPRDSGTAVILIPSPRKGTLRLAASKQIESGPTPCVRSRGGDRVLDLERTGCPRRLPYQQRDALLGKVQGVSDADARRAPTASSLSLLGLLKHSTIWEQRWFQGVVAGRSLPDGWPQRASPIPDEDFLVDDQDTTEQWVSRYHEAAETSRRIVAAMDLDDQCFRTDLVNRNLRWVMLHLIEETARHAGHADIIREALDGTRGM
jgi:hypothetical protein